MRVMIESEDGSCDYPSAEYVTLYITEYLARGAYIKIQHLPFVNVS